jgi:hypothetical protein
MNSPLRYSVILLVISGLTSGARAASSDFSSDKKATPSTTAVATPRGSTTTPTPATTSKTDATNQKLDAGQGELKVDAAKPSTTPAEPQPIIVQTEAEKKALLAKKQVEADEQKKVDDANSVARGEGERYVLRLKAWEAARAVAVNRPSVPAAKKTSVASIELPNGHCVVMTGTERKEFATKAEADAFIGELKKADDDRIVISSVPRK